MVHGPVREVVRGAGPLDRSMDRGSVFSGHPKKLTFQFCSESLNYYYDVTKKFRITEIVFRI